MKSGPYRIGFLIEAIAADAPLAALQSAAERLGHCIIAASDPAELLAAKIDFAVTQATIHPRIAKLPTFGIVRDAQSAFKRLRQVLQYDGYLTVSNKVRRLLSSLRASGDAEPCTAFFELTPERQFVICQVEKLIRLGALRVCHIPVDVSREEPRIVTVSADRPYLRRYGTAVPLGDRSPQNIFAGFGAGLVLPAEGGELDAACLYRLCEIVSVGAIAICPDTPWIRRHFGETVRYYPTDDALAAAQAIGRAVEEIASDAPRAAAQARQARAVFEDTLAVDIMLANAIAAFEQWQVRASESPVVATLVNTHQSAIAAFEQWQVRASESPVVATLVNTHQSAIAGIFARLPSRTLVSVGQAVAALEPLKPMPHWRFGSFEASCDLAVHLRQSLWLGAMARGGTAPIVVPWHAGTRLKLYLDNDLSLTLFCGGSFEPNEFALLDRVLQPGMVFLDGGANEGAYTVFAAARVGRQGRVFAVEPSTRERQRLKANIALNHLGNVDIVEAALAEHLGSAPLLIAEQLHAGQNTLGAFAYSIEASGREEVAVTTLDDIVLQSGLDRLDIVKLDLEGAELRTLTGARRVLAELRPLILAEVSEAALAHQGGTAAALFELLERAEYVLLTIDDNTGEPVPLRASNLPPSDNIVAVHADRDWGLLPR